MVHRPTDSIPRVTGATVLTPLGVKRPLSSWLREVFGSDLGVIWEGDGRWLARVRMLDMRARHESMAELQAEDLSRPGLSRAP